MVAGILLAFGAGSLVARRAIMPIAELTAAAAEIERTGDPSRTLPGFAVLDDEVRADPRSRASLFLLSAARNETEADARA